MFTVILFFYDWTWFLCSTLEYVLQYRPLLDIPRLAWRPCMTRCIIRDRVKFPLLLMPCHKFLQVFSINWMEILFFQASVEPYKPCSTIQIFGIGITLQPPTCNHRLEWRAFQ